MKVYKEYLHIYPNSAVYTDIQGELLTIEEQRNSIVAYFNAETPVYHKYLIYLIETGKHIDIEDAKYLKTLMLDNGDYVLHVFIKEVE